MVLWSNIERAAEALLATAPAGSRVILFGSQARCGADDRSDVDFLVIEPTVKDRLQEMLRLEEALRAMRLPVDILVLSATVFERWKATPNSIAYRAAREGRVYGPAA